RRRGRPQHQRARRPALPDLGANRANGVVHDPASPPSLLVREGSGVEAARGFHSIPQRCAADNARGKRRRVAIRCGGDVRGRRRDRRAHAPHFFSSALASSVAAACSTSYSGGFGAVRHSFSICIACGFVLLSLLTIASARNTFVILFDGSTFSDSLRNRTASFSEAQPVRKGMRGV